MKQITEYDIKNSSSFYRNLELIQEKEIYTIKITIRKGRKTKSLDWQYLGLSKEQVNALEKYKVNPGSLKIVEIIERESQQGKGHNQSDRLNKLIQRLRNDILVYFPPHYFFSEDQIEEVTEIINKIYKEEERIKDKIEACYEEEYQKQLERIKNIISANPNINEKEVDHIVNKFILCYPSKMELKEQLGIEIEYIEKVPSLIKQQEENVKLKEIQSIQDLQQEYKRSIQNKLEKVSDSVVDEALVLIQEQITKIDKTKNDKLPNKTKEKLEEAIQRVERLANFNSSLKDIAKSFKQYGNLENKKDGTQEIEAELNQVQTELKQTIQQVEAEYSVGHKKVAQWL